jgi:peroxiredoxin
VVTIRFIPLMLLFVLPLGCAPAIPTADGSVGYETLAFKDDAPANAEVMAFPQTFVDVNGNTVDLKKLRGRKVLLVILRGIPQSEGGRFCPSCLAQASGLLANRREFEKRDTEVLVLFPGPAERVGEFLETARRQSEGESTSAFQLLLDQDLKSCSALGIRADLAKPSTYILDKTGRVTYAYVGETSTDRPSVKAVLTQLDRVK